MKTIIAGSRDIVDYDLLLEVINESGFHITSVVSGCARGVDTLGELYAKENNLPLYIFVANWELLGKKAGYLRNIEMANNAEALIVIILNNSRGSLHMFKTAKEKGLKVFAKHIGLM